MKLSILKFALFFVLVIGFFNIGTNFTYAVGIDAVISEAIDLTQVSGDVLLEKIDLMLIPFIFLTKSIILLFLSALIFLFAEAQFGMLIGEGIGAVFIDTGYWWLLNTVNMLFVIALAFVALLYILDIEEGIVDKKTMPRLIIAAFLMNFSLLFVEIILDFFMIIEGVIIASLLPAGLGTSLAVIIGTVSLNYILMGVLPVISLIITKIITKKINPLGIGIPGILVGASMIVGYKVFLAPIVFMIVTNLLLTLTIGILGVLFISRYIMIHLLAMVAPLAFFAIVFPKTRKFFDSWLHKVVTWGSMGIILYFGLAFGLNMHASILNIDPPIITAIFFLIPFIGPFVAASAIFTLSLLANFFLATYFIIMFFVLKQYLPAGAQGVIGLVQKGAMVGGAVAGGAIGGMAIKKYGGKVSESLGGMSERLGGGDTMLGRAAMDLQHATQKKVQEATQKRAKYHKDKTPSQIEEKLEEMNRDGKPIDETKQAALLLALKEKGGLKKVNSEKLKKWGMDNKEFEEALKYGGIDPEAEDALAAYRRERKINEGAEKVKDMQVLERIRNEGSIDEDEHNDNIEKLEALNDKEKRGEISDDEKEEKEKLEINVAAQEMIKKAGGVDQAKQQLKIRLDLPEEIEDLAEKIKEQQIKNSEDMVKIVQKSSEDEIKAIGNALEGDNLEAFVKSVFYNTSDPTKIIAVCGDNMQKAGEKFKELANEMAKERCLAFAKGKEEFLERILTAEPPIFSDCNYQILQQGLDPNADENQRTALYNAVKGTSSTSTEAETPETETETGTEE